MIFQNKFAAWVSNSAIKRVKHTEIPTAAFYRCFQNSPLWRTSYSRAYYFRPHAFPRRPSPSLWAARWWIMSTRARWGRNPFLHAPPSHHFRRRVSYPPAPPSSMTSETTLGSKEWKAVSDSLPWCLVKVWYTICWASNFWGHQSQIMLS